MRQQCPLTIITYFPICGTGRKQNGRCLPPPTRFFQHPHHPSTHPSTQVSYRTATALGWWRVFFLWHFWKQIGSVMSGTLQYLIQMHDEPTRPTVNQRRNFCLCLCLTHFLSPYLSPGKEVYQCLLMFKTKKIARTKMSA